MALIITGFLSGIIGGMGIGGGTILIPIMTIFLGFDQKTAQAVNLIYFIPTAITALTIHIKNKQIEKHFLSIVSSSFKAHNVPIIVPIIPKTIKSHKLFFSICLFLI